MSPASILAFAACLCAGGVASAVAWYERRSIVHWAFAAGMAALAVESLFFGLSADAEVLDTAAHWQFLGMVAMSFLPGFWLFFSLTFARGDYREFLARWRLVVAAAFIAPVILALTFPDQIIIAVGKLSGTEHLVLRLGFAGTGLHLMLLLSAVFVLMNLERTFRASVGTMRWRIKFMILGLVVLFIARAYTITVTLLFHAVDQPFQVVDSGALFVACLLIFRSLFREGHFALDIYPSHSVLQNSLTALLAGIY